MTKFQLAPKDAPFEASDNLIKQKGIEKRVIREELIDFFNVWPTCWYEGYSFVDSSQNNGLKTANRYMKEFEMDNSRLEPNNFK